MRETAIILRTYGKLKQAFGDEHKSFAGIKCFLKAVIEDQQCSPSINNTDNTVKVRKFVQSDRKLTIKMNAEFSAMSYCCNVRYYAIPFSLQGTQTRLNTSSSYFRLIECRAMLVEAGIGEGSMSNMVRGNKLQSCQYKKKSILLLYCQTSYNIFIKKFIERQISASSFVVSIYNHTLI